MSQNMKRASRVEIVLLANSFAFVRSFVCVLASPGYFISFPPTVRWVWYRSYFWVWKSTTILPDVTYFYLFSGIFLWGIKKFVCVFHPAAKSLVYPAYLIGKVFDPNWYVICFLIGCLYSMETPVFSSMISLASFFQIVVLCQWLSSSC